MADEPRGQLKFVCLRYESVLRLHMYTGGGTLMSSMQSPDAQELKTITLAWLQGRGLRFDEADLDAAIGRAQNEVPAP
jgi:hypothetical protein